MTATWFIVMILLVSRSFLIGILPASFYMYAVFIVNTGILGVSYVLFRREGRKDLRSTMLFLLGLTIINILIDLGMMSYGLSWVAFGALIVWTSMGGGKG